MKRFIFGLVFLLLALSVSSIVWALAMDRGKVPVSKGEGGWSNEHRELFNREDRVDGFWVNFQEVLWYAGDTEAFNDFMKQLSMLEETCKELVIHVGRKKARSPWDKEDRDIEVDWKLDSRHLSGSEARPECKVYMRVDVWVGRSVLLEDMVVPVGVPTKSGGEIEEFVGEHEEERRKATESVQ